jgi:hypothetical protein
MTEGEPVEVAVRLIKLSRELAAIEAGRKALLERLAGLRVKLQRAGDRAAALSASINLVCDHVRDVATWPDSVQDLEKEMRLAEIELADDGKEASVLIFEAEGLDDALDETEDELDRLTSTLTGRIPGLRRGH